MNFPSLTEMTGKAQNAFKRFPVTLLWAIFGTVYAILVVNDDTYGNKETQANLIITFILGVSWLIGVQFFIEKWKKPKQGLLLKAGVLVLLLLFYWHLPQLDIFDDGTKYLIRFFLFLIAGHLFVLFAPFLFKWNKVAYWNYLKTVGFAIARSGIFSGVLYLGLVLALAAIDALFEVEVDSDVYFQLFIFCLGIVNTWIYLSDFPKNIHQQTEIHFNKALEVFVKYILIPLVLLYVVILYAYGFKILIQWQLPKGWVSYLVTALALLGFVVQVIINPIQNNVKSWAINQFYPWFYRLLLPLVVLLFVAIFRRIADYGITENRYFVLIIAFWILGMALFLLFSKKKSLIILPLSLFVLALLSSFGFWGASSVSKKSQIEQFTKVFEAVKQNNKIVSSEQHNQLRSILDYLDDRKSVQELDPITGIAIKEMFKDTIKDVEQGTYVWFDTHKVLDSLGITIDPKTVVDGLDQIYFNYYTNQNKSRTYDLNGFQSMTTIALNEFSENRMETKEYRFYFEPKKVELKLLSKNDGREAMVIPLKEKLLQLSEHYQDNYEMNEEEMTFIFENDSISTKLIFSDLGFYMEQDSLKMSHSGAMLFLKRN